jgi:hypothetical protein
MVLLKIIIASFLMMVTTAIHTEGMLLAIRVVRSQDVGSVQRLRRSHLYRIGGVVILMFLASLAEVIVWATTYIALNAIHGFEKALYFSMVTYTTLGYGDILLDERWRLLASFEAANGVIMFGWSTAVVMAAVQHIYFKK